MWNKRSNLFSSYCPCQLGLYGKTEKLSQHSQLYIPTYHTSIFSCWMTHKYQSGISVLRNLSLNRLSQCNEKHNKYHEVFETGTYICVCHSTGVQLWVHRRRHRSSLPTLLLIKLVVGTYWESNNNCAYIVSKRARGIKLKFRRISNHCVIINFNSKND